MGKWVIKVIEEVDVLLVCPIGRIGRFDRLTVNKIDMV